LAIAHFDWLTNLFFEKFANVFVHWHLGQNALKGKETQALLYIKTACFFRVPPK
jgi:hypothetical protein